MSRTRTLAPPKRRAPVASTDPNLIPVGRLTKVPGRYIFVHYEGAWEYSPQHGWIPRLSKLLAKPGCNGVSVDKAGRVSLQGAINGATAKGGTIIYDHDKRLLRQGEDPDDADFYLYGRFYDCTNGAQWWVEPGEVPSVTPAGKVLWNREQHVQIFAAFRAHIRDAGIVEPMHHLTLVEHLQVQQNRVNSLRERSGLNPHLQVKLKEAIALLEAMSTVDKAAEAKTARPVKAKRRRADA